MFCEQNSVSAVRSSLGSRLRDLDDSFAVGAGSEGFGTVPSSQALSVLTPCAAARSLLHPFFENHPVTNLPKLPFFLITSSATEACGGASSGEAVGTGSPRVLAASTSVGLGAVWRVSSSPETSLSVSSFSWAACFFSLALAVSIALTASALDDRGNSTTPVTR